MTTTPDIDPKLTGLLADVDDCRRRIAQQRTADPDHEVALSMLDADLRRAIFRVTEYQTNHPQTARNRVYQEGRRVA